VQREAMVNRGSAVSGVIVRGVLPEREARVSDVGQHMRVGALEDLADGAYGIVIGRELALVLGVGLGDKITLVTPQAAITPAGILPRLRRFTVVGVFEVGMYEYDRATAIMHLGDAQRLFETDSAVTGLRLKLDLDDLFAAPRISRALTEEFEGRYWVRDWTQQHQNFFRALKTERVAMFIVLSIIVLVAAFQIFSMLIMAVTDKRADIAILRTLGLSPGGVMRVFIVQGTLLGLIGTSIGLVFGVLTALNIETLVPAIERLLDTKFLSPEVYYISELPSELRLGDVVWTAVFAFTVSVVATLYPAWRAARTQPAEALRYE
jgi:lipoprotein-releasing system permease protein